jgi:hypothetical protein
VRAVNANWVPPEPFDINATGGIDPAEDTYRHQLTYDSVSGNFTGTIEIWSPIEEDYILTYVVEDEKGNRGPVIKSQIGISTDGSPRIDDTPPTVFINKINNGDKISEKITIEVIGNDEDSGLEQLSLEINGETVETMQMPDYLPYPALTFDLDPYEYKRAEELNITGKAKDRAGASSYFNVFVEIDIPIKVGYVTLIAGGAIVIVAVVTVVGLKIKKKKRDRIST